MENRLFLLQAPAGGGTKIVLNKQSDLILHEAEIIKPSGIEEGDIIGLPEHFQEVERLIKQEKEDRGLADAYINAAIAAEEAARIDDIKKLDKSLNSEVARATAKDAEHDAAIAAESEARTAADAAHDVEIAAIKETEATNVATLQGNIDSEQKRAEAAEKVNADAIAKEVSDRISAVSTEEAARIAGDAALQASLDAMDAAYKSADAGLQSAIDSAQAEINGILSGSTLDANSFAEIVTLINSVDTENDTAFASYVLSNDAALAQEVADRIAGDDKLTGDLAAEVVRATAAEAANAAAIAAEEAARVAGDAALQASLDAEISGRTAADVAFQASLDAEIANRVAGDDTLTTNLNAEVARAEAAEQVNAQAIADEVVARTTKDAEQDAALTTEVDRAKAAEKVNADAIAAEEARAIAAEGVLDTAIKAEEARAIAKDAEHDAALAAEEARAKAAEKVNADAIAAEEARAIAAEGVLDTTIKAEEARAIAKDAEHDAAIAKEEADRVAAIAAEEAARISGDTAIQAELSEAVAELEGANKAQDANAAKFEAKTNAAIAAEEAARISGDTALQASLDAEVDRARRAEKVNAAAIAKEEADRIAAITTQKERIDIILSGSSVDLDQFSEVVKFVEDIDMENDASLISAIDEVRKEHKSDMNAEVSAREKADAYIIAAVGYADRGDASTSHFEGYLDASAEFGQAEQQLAKLSDSLDELTVKISELKGDKAEAEAAGNTDLVNSLTESIAANEAAKAEQEAEKKDLESSGVLHFEAFMPINEVNFEAWKKDVEATELSDVRTELFDSIKKEADSSVGRDSEIIAAVGYNDRGAASTSHFEGYLDASAEFEQATEQLAMLNYSIDELTVKISELKGDKAEAEAAGNTDLVNSLTVTIADFEATKAKQEAEKKDLESSGVFEFEAFMPVNEVNFEAWKKDVEATELKDATSKLNDTIKREADASVERDYRIEAAVGYKDRGQASESHFDYYVQGSAEFEQAIKESEMLTEEIDSLEREFASLQAQKAEAEAAGDTDLVNKLTEAMEVTYATKDDKEAQREEIKSSGVLSFEVYMPVNEVNFEAWKKDTEDAEFKDVTSKLNDELAAEIKRATAAEESLASDVANIIENTDVSKIDSFVEVINEFNKVSAANFDSIYAKKVSVSFDGKEQIVLANPVKPESMMLYINGLMVENGVDYTEIVEGGMVAGAVLLGDALYLAGAGAKLAGYGVHGSFSSVEFNGIDYAALIDAKQVEISKLETKIADAKAVDAEEGAEFEVWKANTVAQIDAALAAGDTATADSLTDLLANNTADREEDKASMQRYIADTEKALAKAKDELAALQAEANEA